MDAYYSDTNNVSNSMLSVFRRSPAEYEARFVTQTLAPKPSTPDQVIGQVTHTGFLQPEHLALDYALRPDCDRRTKEGKATYAAFLQAAAGKQEIDRDGYDLADRMAKALRENQFAGSLLDLPGAVVETPIRWTDLATDLDLKAKPDIYIPAGGTDWAICADLKTTVNPGEAFARQVANFGYHRQAAFYLNGCRAVYDADTPTKFLLVAVGKEEPHDVYVYHLGREWMTVGQDENADLLRRLAECKASGVWLAPEQKTVSNLPFPKYLRTWGE